MLTEVYLRNFVLIEEATLDFKQGLNIISGETGAGKSLIATALSIVLGRSRFLSTHIRKGSDTSTISAVFELDGKSLKSLLKRIDIEIPEDEEGRIVIERQMGSDGRGRTSLFGRPVAVSKLKELGELLFDISAQDEHSFIRDESHQRDLLDGFAKAEKEVEAVKEKYQTLAQLVERIKGGKKASEEKKALLEIIRHQINELESLAPDGVADADIDDRIYLLENAAQLKSLCSSAIDTLYESDSSVSSCLGVIIRQAEDFEEFSIDMRNVKETLNSAESAIDDCVRILRGCEEKADVDPDELEDLIERKHSLQDCARKHKCEIADLPEKIFELKKREQELAAWEEEEENLVPKARAQAVEYLKGAAALREKRRAAAVKLDRDVKKSLKLLGMENADFKIEINPLVEDSAAPEEIIAKASSCGADEIIYAIKPNKGESWGSVSDTASGGETTRVMLAVKSALVKVNPCDVLFFDEIDTGVGGRIAEAVAKQFERLAEERQVIAITHLPQIAAYGSTHLCVRKVTEKGRTRTSVVTLSGEERVDEIAYMIRGEKITSATITQAKEMLEGKTG